MLALAFALSASAVPCVAAVPDVSPLANLQARLGEAASRAPGHVAIAVEDLATGLSTGINATASMPAASTIKIPVMVEVFRQMADGTIDLNTKLHVTGADKDYGWGDLADARAGTMRNVKQLLWLMITESDNTATNMLIRLVGRLHVNREMASLGLSHTRLNDDIRTNTEAVRTALRSSPKDMMRLLDAIARDRLVDSWSSREMLAILAGQHHNGLLPQPLPAGIEIAHKTGSLHDTLDDVGIVYRDDEPYVIAVMTTNLPTLDQGRHWIHGVSRIAYDELGRFAQWRQDSGIAAFDPHAAQPVAPRILAEPISPDETMWTGGMGTGNAAPVLQPIGDPNAAGVAPAETVATPPAGEPLLPAGSQR